MKTKHIISPIVFLLLLIFTSTVTAQLVTVTGTVSDSNKDPLIGVSIVRVGTTSGVSTDYDGKYIIQAQIGDKLKFSYIGFNSKTVVVKTPTLNVILEEDNQVHEEYMVVAYGIQSRDSYTRSTSYIEAAPAPPVYFENTETYKTFTSNQFKDVSSDPLSTFSIDVDKASYSNLRRFLDNGQMPPADAIRVEELINYFSYKYDEPKGNDPVNINTEVGKCPWNKKNRLVKVGLKAKEIPTDELPAANLVFLIDVSGSMSGSNRIGLVKSSMNLLLDQLRPEDRVAIVTYASGTKVNLESTPAKNKERIKNVLNGLVASGATSGGEGIQLAYKAAEENYIKGGNNRIILCTDGDFNVGVSSPDGLKKLVEEKRKSGVFLSVLGYGIGNYRDDMMQSLAEAGNGNHAYIDNMQEANRVLVNEFGGTMYTVAKDVKLQIEFNPLKVKSYRLIGYESRLLENEDFNDDKKDAGDMGVGHTVTAFYEVVPVKDKKIKKDKNPKVDPLKYQTSVPTGSDELLNVKLRYKDPESDASKLLSVSVTDNGEDNVSDDFRFASAVAMFGKMLHDEEQYDASELNKVVRRASEAYGEDEDGYRREFVRLVKLTQNIARTTATK